MAPPTIPGFTDLVEVGRGGFGVVYRSPQPGFGRDVAIKVLDRGGATLDARSRRRFERETQTTGKLSGHPHIVTLHHAGFTGDDHPYLVMAFHDGGSLRDTVDRTGAMAWQDVTRIGVQLCGALATAHAAGIVHRDVKPDNVLVDDFGSPVLTDFGIASVTNPDLATATATGQMTMTIAFSPPEVLDGARPEQRTDVFALGATLFALLTGHPPFVRPEDESLAPVLARMMREDAPRLEAYGVPTAVAEAIGRALSRDLAGRTPSAVAMGAQLQDAQRALRQPVTDMVLPRELDQGDTAERTLALPDLDLPGVPQQTPSGPAVQTTERLGTTPATTPTARWRPDPTPEAILQPAATGRGSGTRAALLGVLVGVVLLVLGGGAYLLLAPDDGGDPVVSRSSPPAATANTTAAPTPLTGPRPPGSTGAAVVVRAAGPQGESVARTLGEWRDGINTGDHRRAFATYTERLQQQVTFEQFQAGNATTVVVAPEVTEVREDGDGVVAVIAFRSLQTPELGPDGQACSDWRLQWTLQPGGGEVPLLVDTVMALDPPQGC